jgi:hypothetical protein
MQSLQMKIAGFDVLNGTILIKFAADTAEKLIDDYPSHQFNVVEENENVKLEEVLKALAQTGWNIAFQQEVAEQTAKDNEKIALYQSLIGSFYVYTGEELFAPPKSCPSENQPSTQGLMVI